MAIKSFTDISQSKKLAEILPIESADMCYPKDAFEYHYAKEPVCHYSGIGLAHPCWSLAALLDTFPKGEYKDVDLCFGGYQGDKYIPEWFCSYEQQEPFIIEACYADNPVDACYEMIIKLKEKNLL